MNIDASLIKSRFVVTRSIWLINCCMITCSIFAILKSSYKVFCAFFRVSFIDNTSVEKLIESNFFLRTIWRCSFALLFRLINASSFDLKTLNRLCLSRCQRLFVFHDFLYRFRLNKRYLCYARFVNWLNFDSVDSRLIDLNSTDLKLIDQSSIDLNLNDLWSFDSSLNDSN
jgi:hypothetical protein